MTGLALWAFGVAMGVALVPAWRVAAEALRGRQDEYVDMTSPERLARLARLQEPPT